MEPMVQEQMQRTQGLMVYLCSLANGLEVVLGRGAESVCFRAGRSVGLATKVEGKEGDLVKAVARVQDEMLRLGVNWPVRPFKRSTEAELVTESERWRELKLVTENCIVRCTLARYGFPQKGSLCNTKHGLFCGIFDRVCGTKSVIDIIHAGENGCLLKLRIAR
jgi:predicted hydrocarbon binding protein